MIRLGLCLEEKPNFMDEERLNRNKNIYRGFRKLIVWQESVDLYVFVKEKIDKINGL